MLNKVESMGGRYNVWILRACLPLGRGAAEIVVATIE
jgi:hypothetical protein